MLQIAGRNNRSIGAFANFEPVWLEAIRRNLGALTTAQARRPRESVVLQRIIVVKLGVNSGDCDGTGYFEIRAERQSVSRKPLHHLYSRTHARKPPYYHRLRTDHVGEIHWSLQCTLLSCHYLLMGHFNIRYISR